MVNAYIKERILSYNNIQQITSGKILSIASVIGYAMFPLKPPPYA